MTHQSASLAPVATGNGALKVDQLGGLITPEDITATLANQTEFVDRRAPTRKSTATKRRLERAQLVLSAMRDGATLHLAFEQGRPCWWLSTGQAITPDIANVVTASASVEGIGDALFKNELGQTWRWRHG